MAKSKGGGGRGNARPAYPGNKPSKTGNPSGSQRSNAPAKGGKSNAKGKK